MAEEVVQRRRAETRKALFMKIAKAFLVRRGGSETPVAHRAAPAHCR
jgi:hypothetical protein